jgi:hypothetical protein
MNDILGNLVTKFSIMDLLSIFNHPKIVLKNPKKKKKKTHTNTHININIYLFNFGGVFFLAYKNGGQQLGHVSNQTIKTNNNQVILWGWHWVVE